MATTSDASVITLGNLKKYNDNLKSTILDPMDAEVKANAADITGIEGLTYGTGKQKLVEKADGSYSSPALIEIQHEMETNTTAIGTLNAKVDGLHPVTWNQLTGKPFTSVSDDFTVSGGALTVNAKQLKDKGFINNNDLAAYQKKLTAGSNITISDGNVISATVPAQKETTVSGYGAINVATGTDSTSVNYHVAFDTNAINQGEGIALTLSTDPDDDSALATLGISIDTAVVALKTDIPNIITATDDDIDAIFS